LHFIDIQTGTAWREEKKSVGSLACHWPLQNKHP